MPDCSTLDRAWSELTPDELYSFLKLRTDVFFLEQKIDETELDDTGNIMLGSAVALQLIGYAVIKQIVKIEV